MKENNENLIDNTNEFINEFGQETLDWLVESLMFAKFDEKTRNTTEFHFHDKIMEVNLFKRNGEILVHSFGLSPKNDINEQIKSISDSADRNYNISYLYSNISYKESQLVKAKEALLKRDVLEVVNDSVHLKIKANDKVIIAVISQLQEELQELKDELNNELSK